VHRVNQFVAHIRARVEPDEAVLAARILPSGGVALFSAMPVPDQRHGLDVAHRLMAAGVDDADVLGAALLHDAAKGHRMRLAHRVGGVLLEAASPRLLARLARDDPRSWRHGFHLYLHHAELSAEMALAAGCSSRLAAFIAGRADGSDALLQRALTVADDAS